MPRTRIRDCSPAPLVGLLTAQADALDATAALREHEADVVIAGGALVRALAVLEERRRAAAGLPYTFDDVGPLLRERDAAALRTAAEHYRQTAAFEAGAPVKVPVGAAA